MGALGRGFSTILAPALEEAYKDCLGEQSQDGFLSDLRKFFAISAVKAFNRGVRRGSAEGAEKIWPGIGHAQDYKDCLGEQSQDGFLSDLRKFFAISAVKAFNRGVRRGSAEGAEKIWPGIGHAQDYKDCLGEQSQNGFLSDLGKFLRDLCGKSF